MGHCIFNFGLVANLGEFKELTKFDINEVNEIES